MGVNLQKPLLNSEGYPNIPNMDQGSLTFVHPAHKKVLLNGDKFIIHREFLGL